MTAIEDYRWLVSEAAGPWLERARAEIAASGGPSVGLVSRLRKDLSAERAHLVVEQIELRQRAREKFALAEQMFFTRKGLEQATDEHVAAAKAARFPDNRPVADLCCGIGGDLIALASTMPARSISEGAVGVERDPAIALLAQANLSAHGCRTAVLTSDAVAFPVADFAAWHIDPDRRPSGKRTTRVELYEPSADAIDSLLVANPNAAIKLAPATQAPEHWAARAEFQWLGSRGECRQQVAWFGALARHPRQHSATVVDARGGERTIVGSPEERVPTADRQGRYLYEPHAAVLAATLTGALCREHDLAAVSPGIAYLTNDALADELLLAAFEVTEVLPFDEKQLRSYFREHGSGRLEVKKRGVQLDPERLRKAVIGEGKHEATLIVTPLRGQVKVIVARRISSPPAADPAG